MAGAPLARDIVTAGSVVLREPADEVPDSMLGTQELRDLVQSMIDTMRAAPGVGLAAPQIGVPLQIIVLEDKPEYLAAVAPELAEQQQRMPFEALVVINPRLRTLSDAGARFYEGCLSVPGYQALVERYISVEVEGLTVEGLPVRLQANGWQARILQHECDHLAGVLYVDRMLSRSFAARGAAGRLPQGVPAPGACRCCHPIDRAG
ncbi:Peptide deformylase chloroplastic [Micractinium conductrix]|uniref:Peptide deformylase n=1 Tax=Micractinium conductrix TaxID=554055 RepID=A0A2P6V240_9CHLO|nr:Peptide deformylase chloroplastic [Micractinium conductrix]|eukprot:PSC68155.1 Peptide deformylase chloroplastic [Micractinium conductrix]